METPGEGDSFPFFFFFFSDKQFCPKEKFALQRQYCVFPSLPSLPLWTWHQLNDPPAKSNTTSKSIMGLHGSCLRQPWLLEPGNSPGEEKTFPSTERPIQPENHAWRPRHPLAAPEGAGVPLTANIFMFCWHFFSHSILMTNLSCFYAQNFKSRIFFFTEFV